MFCIVGKPHSGPKIMFRAGALHHFGRQFPVGTDTDHVRLQALCAVSRTDRRCASPPFFRCIGLRRRVVYAGAGHRRPAGGGHMPYTGPGNTYSTTTHRPGHSSGTSPWGGRVSTTLSAICLGSFWDLSSPGTCFFTACVVSGICLGSVWDLSSPGTRFPFAVFVGCAANLTGPCVGPTGDTHGATI